MDTQAFLIARFEHRARCAQLHAKPVEGITVSVPNAIDRLWMAVRKRLPQVAPGQAAQRATTRGALAK